MYDFGSRLKSIRIKRGFTQKSLALKINKSVSAISSYESNAQLPPLDVLESIALVLNVSLDYLVGLDKYNTYSTKDLSKEQIELLDLLFYEFRIASAPSRELTAGQLNIIYKMFCVFYQQEQIKHESKGELL